MCIVSPSIQSIIPHINRAKNPHAIKVSDGSRKWSLNLPQENREREITKFFEDIMRNASPTLNCTVQVVSLDGVTPEMPDVVLNFKVQNREESPLIGGQIYVYKVPEEVLTGFFESFTEYLYGLKRDN